MIQRVDDPKFPYVSTGKKTATDPLRLDGGTQFKGSLHYVAEFVPAVALKNVHFESASNELQKVTEQAENSSSGSSASSDREELPAVTVSKPIDEDQEFEEFKEDSPEDAKEPKARKSTDTTSSGKTTSTKKTTGTKESAATAPSGPPPTPGVEMTKEELLQHRMF